MRNTAKDDTLKCNDIQKYQFLIQEYELLKAKQHMHFRLVKEFYKYSGRLPEINVQIIGKNYFDTTNTLTATAFNTLERWQINLI